MEAPFDLLVSRGRSSLRQRLGRWRSKGYQIAQCALAGGVAWFIAAELLGHESPFFAPIAAVVSLGTSYGQRLRRVAEVTVGVAVGVFVGDLLVLELGQGWWQIALIIALGMSVAFLLDGGQLFVTQAAVQGVVVAGLLPAPGQALVRWTDALVGGAVALVAATVVPAAPLRRPREQAARIVAKIAELLRAAGEVMTDGEVEVALDLLADARSTDHLVRELQAAADEGMSVVASSPFRIRHRGDMRRMSELVDPLDRALRSTRVLVRQTAVAAYHRRPVPTVLRPAVRRPGRGGGRGPGGAERQPPRRCGPGPADGGGGRDRRRRAEPGALRRGDPGAGPGRGRRPAAAHRPRSAGGDRRAAAATDGPSGMSPARPGWVLHVDLDQFIAAVEVLRRPELAGLPVVVGGRGDPTERGVVSTASYEAREYGVGSGHAAAAGRAQVPGRGVPAGRRAGLRGRVGAGDGDPARPALGGGAGGGRGAGLGRGVPGRGTGGGGGGRAPVAGRSAREFAAQIQAEVLAATAAALLGGDRRQQAAGQDRDRLRQAAGDLAADGGQLVRGDGRPARPRRCGGSAGRPSKKLAALGIDTVAQLAASDARMLADEIGPTMGPWYHRLGRGVDTSPVDATPWVPRAHGREETFQSDLEDWADVETRGPER